MSRVLLTSCGLSFGGYIGGHECLSASDIYGQLRVGGVRVRGEHKLYIQVQSALLVIRTRVTEETRPEAFYPRNWDSPVTRPSWAGRFKEQFFFATLIAACIFKYRPATIFFSTYCKKEFFQEFLSFAELLLNWSSTFSTWRFPGNRSLDGWPYWKSRLRNG